MSSNIKSFTCFSYQLNNHLSLNRSFYHAEFIKHAKFHKPLQAREVVDLKVANFYKEMFARAAKDDLSQLQESFSTTAQISEKLKTGKF